MQRFQSLSNDIVNVQRLESRKRPFHSQQFNHRLFLTLDSDNKVSTPRFGRIDRDLCFIPNSSFNFVGTGLECASLLAGFNRNQSSSRSRLSFTQFGHCWFGLGNLCLGRRFLLGYYLFLSSRRRRLLTRGTAGTNHGLCPPCRPEELNSLLTG